jgi:hypothetical protein
MMMEPEQQRNNSFLVTRRMGLLFFQSILSNVFFGSVGSFPGQTSITVYHVGELHNEKEVKRAGPFVIGPRLGNSPVRSITQCLARRSKTDEFYTLKVG